MYREIICVLLVCCVLSVTNAQRTSTTVAPVPQHLKEAMSTAIGNFSLEVLYFTSKAQGEMNLILSPITIWTALAVIAEGASDRTYTQIKEAARLPKNLNLLHNGFSEILKHLLVNTSTITLNQINYLFVDKTIALERDFMDSIMEHFKTALFSVNFKDTVKTAHSINQFTDHITHGRIKSIVEEATISDSVMLLASAIYFKGQWTIPFNVSSTTKKPFYDANDRKIGEVNMMYNRHTYPFANIKELQARVIELPYGVEERLSMLILLPNQNITLDRMFLNFLNAQLTFDKIFKELRMLQETFGDDEVDCFIPRFKIEASLQLENVLQEMGIFDVFDSKLSRLPNMARDPLYVSKVIHKAEIEVTEDGTTASAVTAAEFSNRIGVLRFEANRPFAYMIVEKTTNTIAFGGIFQHPSLY